MNRQSPDIQFPGFSNEAFEILGRLKANPWIDQYRLEKEMISTEIMEPFKLFRDDIVVNWVLPHEYDLQTERNVFSRLLKNDFGRGACNHHVWFAFYRPGFRRLTDLQLAYSLFPEGLNLGIYLAARADISMARVRHLMDTEEADFLNSLNNILGQERFFIVLKKKDQRLEFDKAIECLDVFWHEADEIWIKTHIRKDRIVRLGPSLMEEVLSITNDLTPLYNYWLG